MISYGGIPLSEPGGDLLLWAEANVQPHNLYEFTETSWPGPGREGWPWQHMRMPLVRFNTLSWPVGAARWAVGHFFASESQIAAIRTVLYQNYRALPLVFSDGANSITTSLWMLPAHPLSTAVSGGGWFLLTLVDDRFFWWQRACDVMITEGTTTWANLYAQIGACLGSSVVADPIAVEYLKPPASLTSVYSYMPLLLDAVATSVGQRVVRTLSGQLLAQNPTTALTQVQAQLALSYPKHAGGPYSLTPG